MGRGGAGFGKMRLERLSKGGVGKGGVGWKRRWSREKEKGVEVDEERLWMKWMRWVGLETSPPHLSSLRQTLFSI